MEEQSGTMASTSSSSSSSSAAAAAHSDSATKPLTECHTPVASAESEVVTQVDSDLQQVDQWTRVQCPQCHTSAKYFCPMCCLALGVPPGLQVPTPKLPLQVDIWFQDKIKKSTAPHAKVLAPQQVNIIPFVSPEAGRFKSQRRDGSHPQQQFQQQVLPEYNSDQVLVVYPTNEASTLLELSPEKLKQVTTLVFIDSPWQKAPVILQSSSLAQLKCVKLAKPPAQSQFWRYHQAGAGCVSTIEAIHLMLGEYVDAMQQHAQPNQRHEFEPQRCEIDQLLFFFNLLHTKIVQSHQLLQQPSSTDADTDTQATKEPNAQTPDTATSSDLVQAKADLTTPTTTTATAGPLPMSEEAKERRRKKRDQKEAGRKRKLENRRKHWESLRAAQKQANAHEEGAQAVSHKKPRNGRCYNCKQSDHEAKNCPNPCRYCKQTGHWSGACEFKKLRYEAEQEKQSRPFTKA